MNIPSIQLTDRSRFAFVPLFGGTSEVIEIPGLDPALRQLLRGARATPVSHETN